MEASASDGFHQHDSSSSSSTSLSGDYARRFYPGIRRRMSSYFFFLFGSFFLLLGTCTHGNFRN